MSKFFGALWEKLNGNKMLLGALVTFGPELLDVLVKLVTAGDLGDGSSLNKIGGLILMAIGAIHKLQKATSLPAEDKQ